MVFSLVSFGNSLSPYGLVSSVHSVGNDGMEHSEKFCYLYSLSRECLALFVFSELMVRNFLDTRHFQSRPITNQLPLGFF